MASWLGAGLCWERRIPSSRLIPQISPEIPFGFSRYESRPISGSWCDIVIRRAARRRDDADGGFSAVGLPNRLGNGRQDILPTNQLGSSIVVLIGSFHYSTHAFRLTMAVRSCCKPPRRGSS